MSAATSGARGAEWDLPMPEASPESRVNTRYPVYPAIPCRVTIQGYGGGAAELVGHLRQVSTRGALLHLERRVPPGALILISVEAGGLIQIEAEVRWATATPPSPETLPAAHGVHFTTTGGAEGDPVIDDLIRFFVATYEVE